MLKVAPSESWLFFICWNDEWRLVRCVFQDTLSAHPGCVQDGRILVNFFICHHEDKNLNAPNQRFWMQHHRRSTSVPTSDQNVQCSYHLVQPMIKNQTFAKSQNLVTYHQWVYLCHKDVFLHGPFDFQLAPGGRCSCNMIDKDDWAVVRNAANLYLQE